jgi:hypothetical protein
MSRILGNGGKLRVSRHWVFSRLRVDEDHSSHVEESERRLEAMAHWRDPFEQQRIRRCRRHSLLDDNPASG